MRIITRKLPIVKAPGLVRFASIRRQLPFRHPASPASVAPPDDAAETALPTPPSVSQIHPASLENLGLRWKYNQLAASDAANWMSPAPPGYDDVGEEMDEGEFDPDYTNVDEVDVDGESDVMRSMPLPYHGEVKKNPTESEADVAADRSDEDPLPPEKHRIIEMPAGEAAGRPTDSEERVQADRAQQDPLRAGGYC